MRDNRQSIWGHIEELRKTFIRVLLIILTGTALSFLFYTEIFQFLTQPLDSRQELNHQEITQERITNSGTKDFLYVVPINVSLIYKSSKVEQREESILIPPQEYLVIEKLSDKNGLILLDPVEGMLITFRICFWVGLLFTSPLWLWQVLHFINPALHPQERSLIVPFFGFSLLFLSAGISFAYFVTIPLANQYFISFNEGIGTNLWSVANYLNYTMFLLLSNGIAFELAVIGLFLVHFGVLNVNTLKGKRRYAFVGAFILGALLTPPDIFSQLILALPLAFLYEVLIIYAGIIGKKNLENHDLRDTGVHHQLSYHDFQGS